MNVVQLKPGRLTTQRRARLRFTIRTLLALVAAVSICIWLGLQVKLVRDRKAVLQVVVGAGGAYGNPSENDPFLDQPPVSPNFIQNENAPPVPWVRRLFGDVGIGFIELPRKTSPAGREQITQLFPEAEIGFPTVPWPTIELPTQPDDLQTFPAPFSTDKSLINDLPSNDHQIRLNDFP